MSLTELKASCKATCDKKYPVPENKGDEVRPGCWEIKLPNGSKQRWFECAGCKEPDPMMFQVRDELWKESQLKGIVCVKCFERAIGRALVFDDLAPCFLTHDAIRHYEWLKTMSDGLKYEDGPLFQPWDCQDCGQTIPPNQYHDCKGGTQP